MAGRSECGRLQNLKNEVGVARQGASGVSQGTAFKESKGGGQQAATE